MKKLILILSAVVCLASASSAAVSVSPPMHWAYAQTELTGTNAYVPDVSTNMTAGSFDTTRYSSWAIVAEGICSNATAIAPLEIRLYPSADNVTFHTGAGSYYNVWTNSWIQGRGTTNLLLNAALATPYIAYLPSVATNLTVVFTNFGTTADPVGYWKMAIVNKSTSAWHNVKIQAIGKVPLQ